MLWFQDFRVGQEKEPCIEFIQENLIESSVQDCLPYILLVHCLCSTTLACPKWLCICLKVNICCICYMILLY